jgi:hypothetical protein
MEWMNDSRNSSGKRIFTEGQAVEVRTRKRICRLQMGPGKKRQYE